jgi:Spy/CpxP family protein refolding chaperone
MTQTTPEQRAELRRLVDAQEINAHYRSDHPEHAAMVALLNAGPALLADAEALAAIEAAGGRAAAVFALPSEMVNRRLGSAALKGVDDGR